MIERRSRSSHFPNEERESTKNPSLLAKGFCRAFQEILSTNLPATAVPFGIGAETAEGEDVGILNLRALVIHAQLVYLAGFTTAEFNRAAG